MDGKGDIRPGGNPRHRLFFPSLTGLSAADLPREALAALTLAAIAIPEQLATARLMGLPAGTGLLTFAAGTLAYALFGRRRSLSIGADSTIVTIMTTALAGIAIGGGADYLALSAWLSVMVGTILVLTRPLNLGWIADLISKPMATGFLAGIAVHIFLGAAPYVLGFTPGATSLPGRAVEMARRIGEANLTGLALGTAVVVLSLLSERIDRRIPGPLVALALAALAVALLPPGSVAMVGSLPLELPKIALGPAPTADQMAALFPIALIVGLVVIMQTSAITQTYPGGVPATADPARDFAAIGLGAIFSPLVGGFAVNASPARTAVTEAAGGRTQLTGVLAVALAAVAALAGRHALAHVPEAALGGILWLIALRLIRPMEMARIWRQSPDESALSLVTLALVVLFPINEGVGLAVLLSLLHSIYVIARPRTPVMERVPGTTIWWALPPGETGETEPGVMVFSLGAPLSFLNARFILRRLHAALADRAPVRLLVIEASGVIDLDYTGSTQLQDAITDLRSQGVEVALARLESERAAHAARHTGLLAVLGTDRVFHSVEEAVRALPRPAPGVAAPRTVG